MKKIKKYVAFCLTIAFALNVLLTNTMQAWAAETEELVATQSDAEQNENAESQEGLTEPVETFSMAEENVLDQNTEELKEDSEIVLDDVVENISISVHQQGFGTEPAVKSGEIAGNINTGKRLEGFTITRSTEGQRMPGSIVYRAHCQSVGWQDWKNEGEFSGTSGISKRLEAVQIQLTGALAESYDIYYRVYMSNAGWLGWTKNGQTAGTLGLASALDGMQVAIVPKTDVTSIKTERYACLTSETINDIIYSGHVQTFGDLASVRNGATLGTVGKAKRLEAVRINLSHASNQMYGSLNYQVHCQTYGWMNSVSEGKKAGTSGEAKRLEAIKITLNGDIAKYCNVY